MEEEKLGLRSGDGLERTRVELGLAVLLGWGVLEKSVALRVAAMDSLRLEFG
ncbi:hypothetical protein PanWU01x14_361010, partial [Parasponia andersonii]